MWIEWFVIVVILFVCYCMIFAVFSFCFFVVVYSGLLFWFVFLGWVYKTGGGYILPACNNRSPTLAQTTITNLSHYQTSQTVTHTDHTVTNTDHTVPNTDHTVTSTDHTVTNTDHSVTNTDHTVTNTDHTVTNTDHTVTNTDHTVTNTDHTVTNTLDTDDRTASVFDFSQHHVAMISKQQVPIRLSHRHLHFPPHHQPATSALINSNHCFLTSISLFYLPRSHYSN